MKIYILPVKSELYRRPKINPFVEHSEGFNCETDFLSFLKSHESLITNNPSEADWHYLPVYWSYWQLSNDYGRSGREEMSNYLKSLVLDESKTFTISEADDEPSFGLNIKVFSGNTDNFGWTPIPILTLPHALPKVLPDKKYLSNFVGNLKGWPIRETMKKVLEGREDVKIIQNKKGEDLFVNTVLESYTTLCPRGSAKGSYRFYESMQLGVVPIMISDSDFRPFKKQINWDSFSYYVSNPLVLPNLLDSLDIEDLKKKGEIAKANWDILSEQTWCSFVLEELG